MNYPDIYFHPDYAHAHQIIENGEAAQYVHRSKLGTVSYVFIKRIIDMAVGEADRYYDIVSPYGYGGPIILECPDVKLRSTLLNEFMAAFSGYCDQQRIVSEFIRFHPVEANHCGLESHYAISSNKKTLATNLVDYGDPYQGEFSKRCRKIIEKCKSAGMTFAIDSQQSSFDAFLKIYASTMNRNNALDYYYFDEAYFRNLLQLFPDNSFVATVLLEGKPIAGGLYLNYGQYVHAHLSGTLAEFIHLSPAYLLKAEVVRWSYEHGYRYVHHGGGYTDSESDGLFKFKKSFSQNTEFDFHVGKRIWNEAVYRDLSQAKRGAEVTDFFPAYRSRS